MKPIAFAAAVASMLTVAPAEVPPPPPPAPVQLHYQVAHKDGSIFLEGDTLLEPHQDARFERHAPRGTDQVELRMVAEPTAAGTVIKAQLFEQSADGEKFRWDPTVTLRSGAASTAQIQWSGGGRTLTVVSK